MKKARPRSAKRPGPVAQPAGARTSGLRFAALLIVVAAAVAYANSLSGPFIFDDHRTIEDNPSIRQIWPLTAVLYPRRQTPVAGRPLANLSFAINYAIGGFHVEGYHLVNVTVHILAALALFGVLRRTFALSGQGAVSPPKGGHYQGHDMAAPFAVPAAADRLALVCALVWTLHPLNTEAVDYITQRTESMAGLFYLLTLYAAIRGWNKDGPGRWSRWPLLAALASACGMATKESMVTVPVMVMLYDRIFMCSSWQDAFKRRGRLYAWLAAGWLLFAALAMQTPFFSPVGFATRVSPWTYLVNQAPAIATYLRLSVWPRGLVMDYGVPQALSVTDVWPSAALVVGLMALSVVVLVRAPRAGFWGAWFFITLAPASSVLPIPTEVAAERRMYLPLVAVVVVLVVLGWFLLRRIAASRVPARSSVGRVNPWIGLAPAAVVLVGLGAVTVRRNAEYRTGVGIWQTVLERRPHPRAHLNLAAELRDAGRLDEAVAHLRTAAPNLPDARRALGFELLAAGKVQEATAELSEFVRLQPGDPEIIAARETLGKMYLQAGDVDRAKEQFQMVTSIAPQYAMGHLYLADLLMATHDYEGAGAQYRECLRLQPNNIAAQARLGRVLASSGRADEAIQVFQDALRTYPAYDDARRDLIGVLLQRERFADAERESRALVASHADDAEAHNSLGVALASQGRFDEAAREFAEAVRLNPASGARENLARAVESSRLAAGAPRGAPPRPQGK